MSATTTRCEARTCPGPHYLHYYDCTRNGKYDREGHMLCGIHKNQWDVASSPMMRARYAQQWGWNALPPGAE